MLWGGFVSEFGIFAKEIDSVEDKLLEFGGCWKAGGDFEEDDRGVLKGEVGRQKMEDGSLEEEVGRPKIEDGSLEEKVGRQKMEDGRGLVWMV